MKANKCCCCGHGLRAGEAIYADSEGRLSINGKPYCQDCYEDVAYDYSQEPEETDEDE